MSMYEVLLLNLYRNLGPSLFLLSSIGESFVSTCRASTSEVLKAPVYILMPSLYMLSSFFNLSAEAVLCSWQSYYIFLLHCIIFLE